MLRCGTSAPAPERANARHGVDLFGIDFVLRRSGVQRSRNHFVILVRTIQTGGLAVGKDQLGVAQWGVSREVVHTHPFV